MAFVTVVPSPYQRDMLGELAALPDLSVTVYYMEKAAPDSPWPQQPLAPHERYLPGFWFPLGGARVHWNCRLPNPSDYDVIVCNTLMSLTGQWLMRARCRRSKWMFWGEKLGAQSAIHDRLTAPLGRAAGIAAIGSWAERDYAARFSHVPIFNIPYYCRLRPFLDAPKPRRAPGSVTFLFCGQMIARKGVDCLLAAFSGLPESARLLLVGREAELPRLLGLLPAPVRARIRYAGFQAPGALPEFFAQADVFVLPSRYDGWGVVVNQALGAGLPIIVSDRVGAGYDLVRPGENGFVVPAGDQDALAGAMRRYLSDETLRETHATSSLRRAPDWLPERGADAWRKALQAVVA